MNSYQKLVNIAGWTVFAIAFIVYFMSAERLGSLWDCGEFIAGALKLEVVHPPGAPLFCLIGSLFASVGRLFSNDPTSISFAVNIMSGMASAFAAMFVCWIAIRLGRIALVGRDNEIDEGQSMALLACGIVAGLSTAFCTSIWFSAVEGEVYAMSTFFTAMTLWAMVKWYTLSDDPQNDRWVIFAAYSAGLSIGVHLLSLLTFPALALFYYFKKYKNPNIFGMAAAAAIGVAFIVGIQKLIIVGIPTLWNLFEIPMVNSLGAPFHSGIIPALLLVGSVIFFGLRYAHKNNNAILQNIIVAATLVVISYSTIGVVVIRANANTPINMNEPSDITRLLPYINREQYGERPLLYGPHFDAKPSGEYTYTDRYGRVGDKYELTELIPKANYASKDKSIFPRLTHNDPNRRKLYRIWLDIPFNPRESLDEQPLPPGRPSMKDNLGFFASYQIGWMYWRYFMWNFTGRQNGQQGFYPDDPRDGHWLSGIGPVDSARLYNQGNLPDTIKNDKGRNTYYFLPLIFGIFGIIFHIKRRPKDFMGLLAMFIITGIGIIIYSNQPPNEPRERDYVLVGSFFTYCIWIGMGVLAIFQLLRSRANLAGKVAAPIAGVLVMMAPLIMAVQNFDDHDRSEHTASRDYAANFLESCAPNAIIFTYGDNDTYPLWYCQEVENIRTDVRVVNLSLIQVDWYINQLRRKVNNSPPIKMAMDQAQFRGKKRQQLIVDPFRKHGGQEMSVDQVMSFANAEHPVPLQTMTLESYVPTNKMFIKVDKEKAIANGIVTRADTASIVTRMRFNTAKSNFMKGDLAVLDIINSNMMERPVYFAVTCREESLMGLKNYLQLEGLGLKLVPINSTPDKTFQMIGGGRVDADKVYENVMNKWRWGNFDKENLFVDRSYAPSIQTQQMIMLRAAESFLKRKENQKAIELMDKRFEAFPHMNFPFGRQTLSYINVYLKAGAYEKAQVQLKTLAHESVDMMNFYDSLGSDNKNGHFRGDVEDTKWIIGFIFSVLDGFEDEGFKKEMKDLLGPYDENAKKVLD